MSENRQPLGEFEEEMKAQRDRANQKLLANMNPIMEEVDAFVRKIIALKVQKWGERKGR